MMAIAMTVLLCSFGTSMKQAPQTVKKLVKLMVMLIRNLLKIAALVIPESQTSLEGLRNNWRGLRNLWRGLRNLWEGLRNLWRGLRNL